MIEISWTALKQETLQDIKAGECLKVTGDGQLAFFAVVKPEGPMIDKIQAICSQIDASKGF